MARIRSIKPEFFSHELLSSKSAHARLLAIGLLTLADCKGRLRWVPMQVHAQVFPWEATVNIEVLLREILDAGYVVHYEVDGKRYVEIVNFTKHQRLSGKEAAYDSRLPAPPAEWLPTVENPNKNKGEANGSIGEPNGKRRDASPGSIGNPLGTGEQGNRGTVVYCPEVAEQPSVPPFNPSECKFPIFPCSGKVHTWQATDQQLAEWASTFPGVNIEFEHRKAHGWIMAQLSRRKTAGGMPKFLYGWLSRQQDSPRSSRVEISEDREFSPPKPVTRAAPLEQLRERA